MNSAVLQRLGERLVHEAVLVEQRQSHEAGARDRHLKVVAAAGAVLDPQFGRVGEGAMEQGLERLSRNDSYASARPAIHVGLWPAITRRQCPPSPLARLTSLAAVECGLWTLLCCQVLVSVGFARRSR